jgi:hypothetical protein
VDDLQRVSEIISSWCMCEWSGSGVECSVGVVCESAADKDRDFEVMNAGARLLLLKGERSLLDCPLMLIWVFLRAYPPKEPS